MWILYALVASALWGIEYTYAGKALEKISVPALLGIQCLFGFICMLIVMIFSQTYVSDLHALTSSRKTLLLALFAVVAFLIANAFIFLSIQSKNATMSGLIEISYPLFIALFSWLLFREQTINLATGIGAAFIFIGVTVIYIFNK